MWSADVAALSVDGWQPNEDAVVMRSQRLVTSVPPDTVQQCRPGIGVSPDNHRTGIAQMMCAAGDATVHRTMGVPLPLLLQQVLLSYYFLQCFDTVGWVI